MYSKYKELDNLIHSGREGYLRYMKDNNKNISYTQYLKDLTEELDIEYNKIRKQLISN